jgi:hypothetical protein
MRSNAIQLSLVVRRGPTWFGGVMAKKGAERERRIREVTKGLHGELMQSAERNGICVFVI